MRNNISIYLKIIPIIAIYAIVLVLPITYIYGDDSVIIINEIAWMGTKNSYNDEWIELYNPNDFSINADNWTLLSKDETLFIKLSGIISAKSYFLLERTDDSSVPQKTADYIYKGGLSNQGEHLILLNKTGQAIDEIDCSLGWFAGNNENKKTMERINFSTDGSNPKNWKTSQLPGGTPGALNSPNENIIPIKNMEVSEKNHSVSNFFPPLVVGFGSSACIAGIFSLIWLKIKKKSSNININD
ncbi:MAG: lamin tail domain-containing protein [Candidatus Parcubacteria bacterium]|nr:lamin tail domain-containing protein [Candidatus Parcubacteria bacterium]